MKPFQFKKDSNYIEQTGILKRPRKLQKWEKEEEIKREQKQTEEKNV